MYKEVAIFCFNKSMISPLMTMEQFVAVKAVSTKSPINCGFIVDLQILKWYNLYINPMLITIL